MDEDIKGIIIGLVIGALIGAFITGVSIDNGYRQVMEQETLDEICIELAGEPSVYSLKETTRHQLICNPTNDPDDIVLDDGKIILRGYE